MLCRLHSLTSQILLLFLIKKVYSFFSQLRQSAMMSKPSAGKKNRRYNLTQLTVSLLITDHVSMQVDFKSLSNRLCSFGRQIFSGHTLRLVIFKISDLTHEMKGCRLNVFDDCSLRSVHYRLAQSVFWLLFLLNIKHT